MAQSAPIPVIYSRRVRRAIQFAELAHRGAVRKNGGHPYFLHLVGVASLLTASGADDDEVCAGWLHDGPEDTETTLFEIVDEFGERVGRLVAGVTKPERDRSGRELSRVEVAEQTRAYFTSAPVDECFIKAADLAVNTTDLVLDHDGWLQVFRSPEHARMKIEHYLRLVDILIGRLAEEDRYTLVREILRERSSQLRALFEEFCAA